MIDSPFLERVAWHARRVAEKMDRRFFLSLLAVSRTGTTFANPGADLAFAPEDDLVVVAESLGTLRPSRTPPPSKTHRPAPSRSRRRSMSGRQAK